MKKTFLYKVGFYFYKGFTDFIIDFLGCAPINGKIKKCLLQTRGAIIGKRLICYQGVWIDIPRKIKIGDDVDISKDVTITTGGGVVIGDRVLIGYGSKVLSTNHIIPENVDEPIRFSGHDCKTVSIEDDVWIGANVIILPGVKVGRGSVIAAGAVVTREIPQYSVAAGVPAKIIRSRI